MKITKKGMIIMLKSGIFLSVLILALAVRDSHTIPDQLRISAHRGKYCGCAPVGSFRHKSCLRDTGCNGQYECTNIDSDSDGWSDGKEKMMGTNPFNRDTDGDGIADPADPNPLVPEKKTPGFTSLAFLTGLGVGFLIAKSAMNYCS